HRLARHSCATAGKTTRNADMPKTRPHENREVDRQFQSAIDERTGADRSHDIGDPVDKPSRRSQAYAQLFAHHPVISLTASFAVGFGLGVLATAVLAPRRPTWGD